MESVVEFLKPNWMKLIFLVELPLYLLIELFRRGDNLVPTQSEGMLKGRSASRYSSAKDCAGGVGLVKVVLGV
jgi:hypothetical protein